MFFIHHVTHQLYTLSLRTYSSLIHRRYYEAYSCLSSLPTSRLRMLSNQLNPSTAGTWLLQLQAVVKDNAHSAMKPTYDMFQAE